jgi:lysophospholipase L1-like esterase
MKRSRRRLRSDAARIIATCLLAIPGLGLGIEHRAHYVARTIYPPRIAIVGDSLAYGAYDTVRGGWVTRLERILGAAYPAAHLRILNAAGNGGNFGNLAGALRWVERHAHPQLVIIAYGLNDFDEHIAPSTIAAQLRDGLRTMQRWKPRPAVFLMGLPPITALSPLRMHLERAYGDVIRRTAAAEHTGYLDEFDLWLALGRTFLHTLRHDTEHPNPYGYAFTAATVAAFLEGAYLDNHGRIRPPADPPTCAPEVCAS